VGTPTGDAAGGDPTGGASKTNMTAHAASGLSWSSISTVALVIANLVYTATVSRLLDPTAFGLMAMANLVVLFALYFVRMGLASALVQKPDLSEEEIRAASSAGILVGLACLGLVWLVAPAVGDFFHAPGLAPVLRGLAFSFLFSGWSMTGIGLLRRELRFREMSVISVGAYFVGYLVIGIGLALLGAGVWSLVAATVTSTAIQAFWQYAIVRHPLRPVWRWRPYRTVCGYGAKLSAAHLVDYFGSNLDTFTVARIASTAVLGQYSRAYYLVFQPLGNYLSGALANVVFSTLSRIQEDLDRLRRAYLSILSLSALVLFPLCVGMAVAARELVAVVLGPQWQLAVGLVPWFALAGGCHVASQLSQSLAEARAELNRSIAVQVAYLVGLAILILLVLPLRAQGVWMIAAAVAVAELLRYIGYLILARKVLGLTKVQVWQAHLPAAFASAGVGLAIAAASWVFAEAPPLALLAIQITVGALALAVCVRFCPVPSVRAELWMRLLSAGLLEPSGGWPWRLARLVLGKPVHSVPGQGA
jgi:lipopolysaccharide exporter